ncbi:MAG: diphthamide synthesis protein [Candidatus Altiarchaeota archaeon]|nr:diphthamide synthesis protein [Candidatus Altiarchaeota archaeon]
MIESDYDFEMERVIHAIKEKKACNVGLQFPEGLKQYAVRIAKEIEERTNAETVIFIDPVYGACDTKDKEAEMLRLDLVVHFGHTSLMPKQETQGTF